MRSLLLVLAACSDPGVLQGPDGIVSLGELVLRCDSMPIPMPGTITAQDDDITISEVSFEGSDAFAWHEALPWTLEEGQTRALPLHFVATSEGQHTARATLVHDGRGRSLRIPLNAAALLPTLSVSPANIDFDSDPEDRPSGRSIAIRNQSGQPITLGPIRVSPSPAFQLRGPSTLVVPPRAVGLFDVVHDSTQQEEEGEAIVEGCGRVLFRVPLTGTSERGAAAP